MLAQNFQTVLKLDDSDWLMTDRSNPQLRALHNRHYSAQRVWDDHTPGNLAGPGRQINLISPDGGAAIIFLVQMYRMDDYAGFIGVPFFRNESNRRSSDLIISGELIAAQTFGPLDFFTFVDGRKVKSENPGYCFQCAGYRKAGKTKKGLTILVKSRLQIVDELMTEITE